MRNNVIKNKPCQFKPTHLKLQLIMKVELVMSMKQEEEEEDEDDGGHSGLRDMFCNLYQCPEVNINF